MKKARWQLSDKQERLRQAYEAVFLDKAGQPLPEAKRILADLQRLARIYEGPAVISPGSKSCDIHLTMLAAGRREVYDRVIAMLGLDDFVDYHEESSNDRPSTAES